MNGKQKVLSGIFEMSKYTLIIEDIGHSGIIKSTLDGDFTSAKTTAQYIAIICHNAIIDGTIGRLSDDIKYQGNHGKEN
jgi:hypothetical protein